jgi:hypothetical protein
MNTLIYGLSWSLPFLSEELPKTEKPAEINVTLGAINENRIAWSHAGVCYKASPGAYFLDVPGVARYLLTNGDTIVIDAHRQAMEQDILHFLYNPVAGALLMQRGILPLQASAVERDGKAAIFLGSSASGKSLVAAGLMQRGFNVVADNICAVYPGEKPMVKAGHPYLLLWNRALQELGYRPNEFCRFRQHMEKYRLPIAKDSHTLEAAIERLYLLAYSNGNIYSPTGIMGQKRFQQLLTHTYHNPLIEAFGMQKAMCQIIMTLAQLRPLDKINSSLEIGNARKFIDAFADRYQP